MSSSGGTKRWIERQFAALALLVLLGCGGARSAGAAEQRLFDFDLGVTSLDDALTLLGMQAQLQIVYDPAQVQIRYLLVVNITELDATAGELPTEEDDEMALVR